MSPSLSLQEEAFRYDTSSCLTQWQGDHKQTRDQDPKEEALSCNPRLILSDLFSTVMDLRTKE